MFISSIVPAPDGETGDRGIGRKLSQLAVGLDARFVRAGTTLATAIEKIEGLVGDVEGIVQALDDRVAGTSVSDMRRVAQRLEQLPDQQQRRSARMKEVSVIAKRLNDRVREMQETLRVLDVYGMNIKIASLGEGQFVGFVEEMKSKLASGETHLAGFGAQLKSVRDAVASVQHADGLLSGEIAKVVPEVPRRLFRDSEALSTHLSGVARLAAEVAEIARDVQSKIAVVLGAMQVGDSTRQRIEHVVSALGLIDAHVLQDGGSRDDATAGHVERLLAAQLDAALAEFSCQSAAMLASLADLRPDTVRLLALIDGQGSGGGRNVLVRLDRGISDVERVTTRLREADGRSRSMAAIIADTIGDLSSRLSSVQRIRVDVQDIAINTRLLCQRHGLIGDVVSVISSEVGACTVSLRSATSSVAADIAALDAMTASLRCEDGEAEDRDLGETLATALAAVRQAWRRTDDAMAQGGGDARRLTDLLTHAATDLGEEMAIKDVVSDASRRLRGRTADLAATERSDATLRTLLPAIASLYTMASEREIHARFLLPGMAQAEAVATADDDDDGLF